MSKTCSITLSDENYELLNTIFNFEGGYVNHKHDRGGPTNHGVTQKTLNRYRGRKTTIAEVKALTRVEAEKIIYELFLEMPGYNRFTDIKMRTALVDISVNSGPSRANKLLQKALNDSQDHLPNKKRLVEDGILGSQSMAAYEAVTKAVGVKNVVNNLVDQRIRFFAWIVANNRSQASFIKGWIDRALSFRWVA